METTAVPVSLGVFYVFRDPAEQQDFLSARSRRAIDWTQISARLGLGGPPADRWETLYSEHEELLDAFGSLALSLGRLPGDGDFKRVNEVAEKLGSLKRGLRALVQGGGAQDVSWGSRLSSWLVDWKALDSGCADDFAIGGRIQSFEYLVVGHSFLAEKFPLLLHEAVRVQEHGNGALLLAGGRLGWVLESCSGWLLRLHLELGLVRAGACQYLAFSGITNRTPPLGSGTSPA